MNPRTIHQESLPRMRNTITGTAAAAERHHGDGHRLAGFHRGSIGAALVACGWARSWRR